MEKIVNATQHNATPEQLEAGVVEVSEEDKAEIKRLLTFQEMPTTEDMENRAKKIIEILKKYRIKTVMIGGAPFFMSTLERVLKEEGFIPVYAFSTREVVEERTEDGKVIKKSIFKHKGFVKVG